MDKDKRNKNMISMFIGALIGGRIASTRSQNS